MLVAMSMKKMPRQMFSVFEAEALNNIWMRNYKYSFNRNFIIFWQMCCFFLLVHQVLVCDY